MTRRIGLVAAVFLLAAAVVQALSLHQVTVPAEFDEAVKF